MPDARIVALPGDGIGPEIMAAARELLESLGDFEIDERVVGGASIDAHGTALTDEVLDACRGADAVLLAAVGGPKWDTTDPDAPRPEQGLLGLRKGLGLYAGSLPPLPPQGLDVRELVAIVYGRPPKDPAPPPGFPEVVERV
ncbi:MAG: isocitrate/isopropylmalate family dehydrogenase, partial [Thermoleophilaceae bacterium]